MTQLEKSYSLHVDANRRTVSMFTTVGGKTTTKRIKIGVDRITTTDENVDGSETITTTKISREVARQVAKLFIGTVSRNKREGVYAGRKEGISARVVFKGSLKYYPIFPSSEMVELLIKQRTQGITTPTETLNHE